MTQIPQRYSFQRLLSFVFLLAIVGHAWGEDYTLSFTKLTSGTNYNSYTAAHDVTSSEVTWSVYGNQGLGDYLRVGGKNTTATNRTLTSGQISIAVSQLQINHNGTNNGKDSSITVNSIKLEVADNTSFTNADVITKTSPSVSNTGNLVFTPTEDKSWAANSYYRITVNYQITGSNNCYITIDNVVLTEAATATKTLSSIAVSGTPTKTTYEAGEALNPAGLVVTGTYSDASTATITDGIEWAYDYGTGNEALTAGATTCDVMASVGQITSNVYTVTGLTVNAVATKYNVNLTQPAKATITANPASAAEGATVTLSYSNVAEHYHFVKWYVLDGDAKEVPVNENTFTMPASAVEVEATFEEDAKHCVTYSINGNEEDIDEFYEGADITFPADPEDVDGMKFVGWVADQINGTTDDKPTFVTSVKMGTEDVTYYAVFADVNGAPDGSTQNASMSVSDYASANSWTNDTYHSSMTILSDVLTATADSEYDSGYTGRYYTFNNSWRLYQSEKSTITVTAASGYVLESVIVTYDIKNTGIMTYGVDQIESGTKVNTLGSSATFGVSNTTTATNGQVQITKIAVEYHTSGNRSYSNYCTTIPTEPEEEEVVTNSVYAYKSDKLDTGEYVMAAAVIIGENDIKFNAIKGDIDEEGKLSSTSINHDLIETIPIVSELNGASVWIITVINENQEFTIKNKSNGQYLMNDNGKLAYSDTPETFGIFPDDSNLPHVYSSKYITEGVAHVLNFNDGNFFLTPITQDTSSDVANSAIITFFKEVVMPSKLNSKGYATYSAPYAMKIEGAQVYTATLDVEESKITCYKVEDNVVPAGVGVLLYGEEGAEVTSKMVVTTKTIGNNDLKATSLADGSLASIPTNGAYVLSGGVFKTYTGTSFVDFKAYFEIPASTSTGESKLFSIVFVDEETAVTTISTTPVVSGTAYNLAGQRVLPTTKGIVIINGKKYFNK